MKRITYILLLLFACQVVVQAQQPDLSQMTKEDVLELSYDELLEMPFEDVLKLADLVGVSLEELYEMLLNKDVSSASKKAESSFEAPLSTTVLSHDEIVQSGARNIEEALRLIPGMIVREKTTGNFDIHIRGNDNIPPDNLFLYSENSMSLVMIDGRQVYNYVNGGTFWETLPIGIADIDRIEVVRGPASALYGANAATGVINIITLQPDQNKITINGSVSAGSLNTKLANISVGQAINPKIGYRVSANYEYMDRTTDKLYSFEKDSMYTVQDLFNERDPLFPWLSLTDPDDGDGSVKYPTPGTSRDKMGVNGMFFYDPNEDISTRLSFGTQNSQVLTSSYGDQASPLSTRSSNTSYLDFYTKLYGLTAQVNYNFGIQDAVEGDDGFKYDMKVLGATGEYDFYFKGLNIRPGIYYQNAQYDDSPYLTTIGDGFLNGNRELSSIAGGLRLDYNIANFRVIAGARAEKYSVNNELFIPFQFLATYNLNEKHLFRANYSSANRSPFLVDTYADYEWNRTDRRYPATMQFSGSEDLKLATIDMVELGYRVKPHKTVQIDIEAFYSKTKDFGYLSPDSIVGNFSVVDSTNHALYGRVPIPTQAIPEFVNMAYQNIEIESEQIGVTANIDWVVNKNLIVKFFGTYQQTILKNYYPLNTTKTIEGMMVDAGTILATNGSNAIPVNYDPDLNPMGLTTTNFFNGAGYESYPSMLAYSNTRPDTVISEQEHKATPSYFGGFSINYTPIEKLNIFASSYFYGKQEFTNQYGTYEIDAKTIINLKVSYKIYKQNTLFINARNLLNSSSPEFGFLDETSGVYLIGLDIIF